MSFTARALALLASFVTLPAIARAQLPTVTIAATDSVVSEVGPDAGTFRVTRVGDTALALTVFFTIGGSATNGADYEGIAASVSIPAGASFVDRVITPLNDSFAEGSETVVLTLSGNAQYVVGAAGDATLTISDGGGTTTTTTSTTSTTPTSATTTSTSTTTSSTVTTSTSTTTTTLPLDDCDTTPDGPTFFSIECRIAALGEATRAESGLAALRDKLVDSLRKATDRETLARNLCAGGQVRRPKERLADGARQLSQYSHRLRNRAARRKASADVREPLALEADTIRGHVRALRAALICPDAAMP